MEHVGSSLVVLVNAVESSGELLGRKDEVEPTLSALEVKSPCQKMFVAPVWKSRNVGRFMVFSS